MRDSLDTLGIKFATDKASQFSRTYAKPHDYLVHLEPFLEPLRDKEIKLLEIGCGGGESVRMWLEYFQRGQIYSVDIVSNTNEWNTPGTYGHPRYRFTVGNQSDVGLWNHFTTNICERLDVIIDDGSHYAIDMKNAFTCLWAHLNSGGLYVIEDLNFDRNSRVWLEGLISHVHDSTFNIDSIYFAGELCIMRKR